jgi:hypothetical protein
LFKKPAFLLVFLFFFGDIYGILSNSTVLRGYELNQKYKDIYQKSIQNREEFWKNVSENIFLVQKTNKNFKLS